MVEALAFRQGTVITWTRSTGENTVNVGGTVLSNLPMLTMGEVTNLVAGDVVGLLRAGTQYFVLGRIDLASAGGGSLSVAAATIGRGLLDGAFFTSAKPTGGTTSTTYATTTLELPVTSEANRLLRVRVSTSVLSTVAGDRVSVAVRDITNKSLPDPYAGTVTIPTAAAYDPGQGYAYLGERAATVDAGPRAHPLRFDAYDDRGYSGERIYQVAIARTAGTGTCRIDAADTMTSDLDVEDLGPLYI